MMKRYLWNTIFVQAIRALSADYQILEDENLKVLISTDDTVYDDFGSIISMQMKFLDSKTNETVYSDNLFKRGCTMNWQVNAIV